MGNGPTNPAQVLGPDRRRKQSPRPARRPQSPLPTNRAAEGPDLRRLRFPDPVGASVPWSYHRGPSPAPFALYLHGGEGDNRRSRTHPERKDDPKVVPTTRPPPHVTGRVGGNFSGRGRTNPLYQRRHGGGGVDGREWVLVRPRERGHGPTSPTHKHNRVRLAPQ